MNCYVCDSMGRAADAVAICRHCGVALCREHVDEGLLASRPSGLVRHGCIHDAIGTARSRRGTIKALEASW
jgi:hypothetical protein